MVKSMISLVKSRVKYRYMFGIFILKVFMISEEFISSRKVVVSSLIGRCLFMKWLMVLFVVIMMSMDSIIVVVIIGKLLFILIVVIMLLRLNIRLISGI